MPEDYKVYLGNVPEDARERDVEKFFKGYGHVFNIVLKVNIKKTGLWIRIRINLSCWSRIQEGKNDPQKKVKNFHALKCWMFSFES